MSVVIDNDIIIESLSVIVIFISDLAFFFHNEYCYQRLFSLVICRSIPNYLSLFLPRYDVAAEFSIYPLPSLIDLYISMSIVIVVNKSSSNRSNSRRLNS